MAQEFNTGVISVTASFLEALKVPFTKKTLKHRLESNPYYPSLYSVSKVLDWYNIPNKALEVKKEELDKLPLPFLAYAHIKEIGSSDFINVKKITNDSVSFFYQKEETISRKEFTELWSGIVLLAEPNDKSKEKDLDANQKAEARDRNRMYFLMSGFSAILLGLIVNYSVSADSIIASSSLLLFTLIGLTISILLLIYEIDRSNAFVKNICTGGAKINCDAVLGSSASKWFGISWSEIGFFYFGFTALFLLIPGIPFAEKTFYISYISLASALYIPFSLWYQYKVVKQWCRLCLFIQGVLF